MEIETSKEADCLIVRFPEYITLDCLESWSGKFKTSLVGKAGLSLLLDTNLHNFDSVECLKWLRKFLTQENVVIQAIDKVAFVQPEAYRQSEVVSDSEAYFNNIIRARKWLNLP